MTAVSDVEASGEDGATILDRWTARKVQPVVALYVVIVFAAFIAAAHFVAHSQETLKALVLVALGAVATTVPGMLMKDEYQATTSGIGRRTLNQKKPRQFEEVFLWDRLSRVVALRRGFKYYVEINEPSPFRRFWKAHLSDRFSGEIHVERPDLERILGVVEGQGITISK